MDNRNFLSVAGGSARYREDIVVTPSNSCDLASLGLGAAGFEAILVIFS